MMVCCENKSDLLMLVNEINKNNEIIKELKAENIKLKEENATFKKEKELLNKCFNLSEEMRDYCKESVIIELREEIKYLKRKISLLKSDLEL